MISFRYGRGIYTLYVKNLSKVANSILERVEVETGKSVQFLRDDKLSALATLQMAENGAVGLAQTPASLPTVF